MSMDKVKLRLCTDDGPVYKISESLPFLLNERALLIHRPRKASIYRLNTSEHMAVQNWCGNTFSSRNKLSFIERPPAGRLVCEACEKRAIMAGEKPSSEIVGEHVCVGKLKVENVCCKTRKGRG